LTGWPRLRVYVSDRGQCLKEPVRVRLAEAEALTVTIEGEFVVLAHAGRWEERLTRAQAWELAEALEAVATAGPGEDLARES